MATHETKPTLPMFYLTYEEEMIRMPVAPSALKVHTGSQAQSIDLIEKGPVSLPAGEGLKEIEITFLLPESPDYALPCGASRASLCPKGAVR